MDSITKWRLNQNLTNDEAAEVIQELFGGSKKSLHYNANEPINPLIVELYKKFVSSQDTEVRLSFTMSKCPFPCVSLTPIGEKSSHQIQCGENTIFIYE